MVIYVLRYARRVAINGTHHWSSWFFWLVFLETYNLNFQLCRFFSSSILADLSSLIGWLTFFLFDWVKSFGISL